MALVLAATMSGSQPHAGKAEEVTRSIPLESCYATPEISGCIAIKLSRERYSFDFEELKRGHNAGASNLALVHGKDIAEAINATRSLFTSGVRADSPVQPNLAVTPTGPLPIWMIAYFGMGPSEPGFGMIHAAQIRGRSIRVSYSRAHAVRVSTDVRHYYFWAPLGEIGAGTYALELFDAVRNEVLLMRRVIVK
jgi:hypothetical protein